LQAQLDINSAQTEKKFSEQLGVTQQAISVRYDGKGSEGRQMGSA